MPSNPRLELSLLDGSYAVCRLSPAAAVPDWLREGSLYAITRTADELSVVCAEALVPPGVLHQPGWRCLKVAGPLDFAQIGVLAALAAPLAAAGVSIFALSTYDTDYLLVPAVHLSVAIDALHQAGHMIV